MSRSSPKTQKTKPHGDRAVYFDAGDEGKVRLEGSTSAGARLSKEGKAGESDRSQSQSRSSSSDKVKARPTGGGGGSGGQLRRIGVVSMPPHSAEIQETDSGKMKAEVARRISLDDLSAAFQGKHFNHLRGGERSRDSVTVLHSPSLLAGGCQFTYFAQYGEKCRVQPREIQFPNSRFSSQ